MSENKRFTRKELINLLIEGLLDGGKMEDEVFIVVETNSHGNYGGYFYETTNNPYDQSCRLLAKEK